MRLFGNYNRRRAFEAYVFIGLILIGAALFAFSWQTVTQIRNEARRSSAAYAVVTSVLASLEFEENVKLTTAALNYVEAFTDPSMYVDVQNDPQQYWFRMVDEAGRFSKMADFDFIVMATGALQPPSFWKLSEQLPTEDSKRKERLNSLALFWETVFNYQPISIKQYRANPKTGVLEERIVAYLHYSKTWEFMKQLQAMSSQFGQTMTFPSIVTDIEGEMLRDENDEIIGYWKELEESLPKDTDAKAERLRAMAAEMDEMNEPIPITRHSIDPDTGKPINKVTAYFHYGDPPLVNLLFWIPLGQLMLILAFILIGFYTYRRARAREQQALWVGMARETAHQLGTPISSLMGWLALAEERQLRPEEVGEFSKDVERLQKITNRFGQIGKDMQLVSGDLVTAVRNAYEYCVRRLPRRGKDLHVSLSTPESLPMRFAPELLEWVVENLIKNAAQSLTDYKGSVDVKLIQENGWATLTVADTGRGIARKEMERIFMPGYSTRTGGWGLGLTLVKRIVEDYHGGVISVKSQPGAGTMFIIKIPIK